MKSVRETAELLAGEHRKEDPETTAVYWAPSDREVYLVEVSKSAVDSGEVLPFRYSSDPPEVPYPSTIILLGPKDWERVKSDDLELPESFANLQPLLTG